MHDRYGLQVARALCGKAARGSRRDGRSGRGTEVHLADARCWISRRPRAIAAGPDHWWPRGSAMSMSSISGASCAPKKIDLAGRKSWCESNDPQFAAKAADGVGLYMAPPENAIVICVDEKRSIQALERTQGYLKLPNGRALTGHSHDYKRNGTSTLFAAFSLHANARFLAQSGRNLVLDPARAIPQRRVLHLGQTTQAAHR